MNKLCTECGNLKSICEFYREKGGKLGVKGKCKVCIQRYKVKNKVRDSIQTQCHNTRIKRAALKCIGGCRCALCFESELSKLNVDHVYGDGVKLRKAGRHGKGVKFYNQILQMTLTERRRLRVLCIHCNVLASRYTDSEIRKMFFANSHGLKYCPACKTAKLTSEFHREAGTVDGLRLRCKNCISIYNRLHRLRRNIKKAA